MKFACQKCAAKYSIGDDKVKGKILRIRCKRCGFIIEVRDPALASASVGEHGAPYTHPSPAPAPRAPATSGIDAEVDRAFGRVVASPARADDDDDEKTVLSPMGSIMAAHSSSAGVARSSSLPAPAAVARPSSLQASAGAARSSSLDWFLAIEGHQHGPMSRDDAVRQIASLGARAPRAYGWRDGMKAWLRVPDVPELCAGLPVREAPKPPAPPVAKAAPAAPKPTLQVAADSMVASLEAAARAAPAAQSRAAQRAPAPLEPTAERVPATKAEAARVATAIQPTALDPRAAAVAPAAEAVAAREAAPFEEPVPLRAQEAAPEPTPVLEIVRSAEPDKPLEVAAPPDTFEITQPLERPKEIEPVEQRNELEVIKVPKISESAPAEKLAIREPAPAQPAAAAESRTEPGLAIVAAPSSLEASAGEAARPSLLDAPSVAPLRPVAQEPTPGPASLDDHADFEFPSHPAPIAAPTLRAHRFPVAASLSLLLILGAGCVLVLGVLDVIYIPFISSERNATARGPSQTTPVAAGILRRDPLLDRDAPRIVVQQVLPERERALAVQPKRVAPKRSGDGSAPAVVETVAQAAPQVAPTPPPAPPPAPSPEEKPAHVSELEKRVFGGGSGGPAAPALPEHLIAKSTTPTADREGLTQEAISRIIRKYRGGIQSCYQKQLRKDSSVRGRLTLSLKIGKNGKVLEAAVEDKMRKTLIAECVVAIARTWRFPPSNGDVEIDYPLILEATH